MSWANARRDDDEKNFLNFLISTLKDAFCPIEYTTIYLKIMIQNLHTT